MIASIWKNYNLGIILFGLFITSWIIQTYVGWYEFKAEQHAHHAPAEIWGDSGYIWPWAKATMENWQSEFLQLFAFVVLTTYFVYKGSHESRDTDDEMMALLQKIDERIDRLEKKMTR